MNAKKSHLLLLVIASLTLASIGTGDYDVGQKNKSFTVKNLTVKVGDEVTFSNQDPFFHNVFSLSETKTFDLGSYPKGKFKSVKFDKPGRVDVECAIHPTMQMTIEVKPL